MGKFDSLLICSDIDGTLIDDDYKLPQKNLDAISYFKSEGGLFTLATGRTPQGAKLYIDKIKPNAPIVCQNGSGIFDFSINQYVWYDSLPNEAYKAVDFVLNTFPEAGIEVICEDMVYFIRENDAVLHQKKMEKFDTVTIDYHKIDKPWIKILIADEPKKVDIIEKTLLESEFADKYYLVRSYSTFYELLKIGTNKGNAVAKLMDITGVSPEKIIVVGDNDNDAPMLLSVLNSYAVLNATQAAKDAAKYVIDTDNNTGAIARLIEMLQ